MPTTLTFKTDRERKIAVATAIHVKGMRAERKRQSARGGLYHFVRYFWNTVEPNTDLIDGWCLRAICQHLEAVHYRDITRLLMNVPPGPMRADSIVETGRGAIMLRDVRVGDMALTHKGRYRPVSAVHDQGVLPILKITTNSGRVTHAAPSHPYLTPNGWVDARDLKVGDVLAVVNRSEDRPDSVSIPQEEALLLGYLVGDGSVTHGPGFTNGDREVIDDFRRCAAAMGFETAETLRGTHWQVRLNGGAKVRNWLEGHGLLGASSYTKRIPHAIMNGGREALAAFVGAYWTCDGGFDVRPTKTRGSIYRAYGTTVSEGLANDLVYALGLLGIESRLRVKHRRLDTAAQPGGLYKSFSIEVQNEQMTALFADLPGLCSRKRALAKNCRRSFERVLWDDRIISIENEDDARCMCLTVEEDHSFVCSGIAVKNSMKSLITNVFYPAWAWSAGGKPGERFLSFSYASFLSERDNERMLMVLKSKEFMEMWGKDLTLTAEGKVKISNNHRGWKFATSVGGVGTGERGSVILFDDPHPVNDSQKVIESTVTWFRETLSNRLNDMRTSAIVCIMQRVSEEDVSGAILGGEDPYVHLMIPMLYEPDRHCKTSIGWSDPRTEEDECYWPERFPPEAVARCKAQGAYAWASQYRQSPEIRGGGLFPRDDWQDWDDPKWPQFSYIMASLDPAFTAKQQNDPSGFTIWGCFEHEGESCAVLLHAWRQWLPLHGPDVERWKDETNDDYRERCRPHWGLVETVAEDCRRYKVNKLLIENKASGHDVSVEMHRLHTGKTSYEFVDPKGLDKHARAVRVQPEFSNGQIWARKGKKYAVMVIDEMAIFPKGRFDDLTDSVTQAIWWLRNHGFLKRRLEKARQRDREAAKISETGPLYEC